MLSQRPDSTGSGIYVQAMIREASAYGYDNYIVAGIRSDCFVDTDCIEQDNTIFVNFHNADLSYHIPGMSDVMPYESTRFCDLSEGDLCEYEKAFFVILEGLASGCRIVATDLPGTKEILDSYTWTGIFKIDKELPLVGSRD